MENWSSCETVRQDKATPKPLASVERKVAQVSGHLARYTVELYVDLISIRVRILWNVTYEKRESFLSWEKPKLQLGAVI